MAKNAVRENSDMDLKELGGMVMTGNCVCQLNQGLDGAVLLQAYP